MSSSENSAPRRAAAPAKPSRSSAADELLALRRAHRLGHPVPLAVGEEAGVADHQRLDRVGVLARPGEADEAAPVVDDERDPPEAELLMQLGERSRLRSKVAGPGSSESPRQ